MFEISWVYFRNRRKKAGNPVELLQENSSIFSVHVPLILITSLVQICLRRCHGYLGIPSFWASLLFLSWCFRYPWVPSRAIWINSDLIIVAISVWVYDSY